MQNKVVWLLCQNRSPCLRKQPKHCFASFDCGCTNSNHVQASGGYMWAFRKTTRIDDVPFI